MAWFKMESATTGVALPNGHRISLDFILGDTLDGFLASENGYIVNQIREAIASRRGGWVEVTQADYDAALKKKANPSPSKRNLQRLNAGMFHRNQGVVAVDSAAVANKPEPIQVPKPEQMKLPARPRVGKLTT